VDVRCIAYNKNPDNNNMAVSCMPIARNHLRKSPFFLCSMRTLFHGVALQSSNSGIDSRITSDGKVVVGWVDEPEKPTVALWRPMVSGYAVKDAAGNVVSEQVCVRSSLCANADSSPT
jgi:hypothetical protein